MKSSFLRFSPIVVGIIFSLENGAFAQTPVPTPSPTEFHFGRDYLRARIEYVYLPQESTKKRSLSLTIKTQNKQGLEFKSVYDPPAQTKVDELKGIIVIDHVALNTKAPLRITQQVREQLDATRWVNLVQNFVTGVTSVFTGGAGRSVSALTQQTNAVNTVVSSYEQVTAVVKSDDWTLFDDPEKGTMKLGSRFSAFTSPKQGFMVREEKGEPFPIHQALVQGEEVVLVAREGGNQTELLNQMRTFGNRKNFPTPYAIRLSYRESNGKAELIKPQEQNTVEEVGERKFVNLYPASKTPFIILQFEKYDPYPDLEQHPEGVPGIAPHFEALSSIFLSNFAADTPKEESDQEQEKRSVNKLVNVEGLKLIDTLQKLTDAGDVSLYDAGRIIDAFCARAQMFNRSTGFMPTRLQAVARRFKTDAQAIAVQGNVPSPLPTP